MAFFVRLIKWTTPYYVLPPSWSFFLFKTGPPVASHIKKWSPSMSKFAVLEFLKIRLANLPSSPGQASSRCHVTTETHLTLLSPKSKRIQRGTLRKVNAIPALPMSSRPRERVSQLVRQDVFCGTIVRVQLQWLVPILTPPDEIAGRQPRIVLPWNSIFMNMHYQLEMLVSVRTLSALKSVRGLCLSWPRATCSA